MVTLTSVAPAPVVCPCPCCRRKELLVEVVVVPRTLANSYGDLGASSIGIATARGRPDCRGGPAFVVPAAICVVRVRLRAGPAAPAAGDTDWLRLRMRSFVTVWVRNRSFVTPPNDAHLVLSVCMTRMRGAHLVSVCMTRRRATHLVSLCMTPTSSRVLFCRSRCDLARQNRHTCCSCSYEYDKGARPRTVLWRVSDRRRRCACADEIYREQCLQEDVAVVDAKCSSTPVQRTGCRCWWLASLHLEASANPQAGSYLFSWRAGRRENHRSKYL